MCVSRRALMSTSHKSSTPVKWHSTAFREIAFAFFSGTARRQVVVQSNSINIECVYFFFSSFEKCKSYLAKRGGKYTHAKLPLLIYYLILLVDLPDYFTSTIPQCVITCQRAVPLNNASITALWGGYE